MKKHNADEIFPLIEAYEKGTLTKEEFCHQTSLKEGSLSYWLGRYRKISKSNSSFVRLPSSTAAVDEYRIEIMLNDGKRIRLTSLVPIEYLESILRIG